MVIIGYNGSQNTDINIGRTKLNINKGSFACKFQTSQDLFNYVFTIFCAKIYFDTFLADTIVIVANYSTTGSSSNAYAQILRNDSRV